MQPIPITVVMMPTAITVTIHPQSGVSVESLLSTLTIGSSGDGVSDCVELLIGAGVAFAGGVGDVDRLEDELGVVVDDDVCVAGESPTVIFLAVLLLTVKLYS